MTLVLPDKKITTFYATLILIFYVSQNEHVNGTDSDSGVCFWPWQCFALENCDSNLTVNILTKNMLSRSAVTFSACSIKQFFSVMFCVVRDVHKLDFRLGINEALNKLWPAEGKSRSDRDSCFLCRIYMFSTGSIWFIPLSLWVLRDNTHSL